MTTVSWGRGRRFGRYWNLLVMTGIVSEIGKPVIIEVSSADIGQNRKVKGTIREFSRKNLTLSSSEEIAGSGELRVASSDFLFLGEVVQSVRNDPANWTVYVNVKRILAVL